MKKKNKIILLIITLLVILSLFFLFYFLNRHKNTLNVDERKWLDINKNNVIDISLISDVPAITLNGKGIVFDYLDYVSDNTDLTFNTVAVKGDNTSNSQYSVQLVDKASKDDLLLLTDNYVFVAKDGEIFTRKEDIKNRKIGALLADNDAVSGLIDANVNQLIQYKTYDELINSEEIDSIVILKSNIMEYIITNNLKISYQFNKTKDYVINLSKDNILSSIMKKYFELWSQDNYEKSYNNHLLTDYYDISKINNQKQTDIIKNTYVYGFINNGIFDNLKSNKLIGINNTIIRNFAEFSNVKIKYRKYNNIKDLIKDLNNKKIHLMFNNVDQKLINEDIFATDSNLSSNLVIVSSISNKINIENINEIDSETVYCVKNSKIEEFLNNNNIKIKSFNNMNELLRNINDDSVIAMDIENYNYYKTRNLKNYKIDYVSNSINYNYIVDVSTNKEFANLFDFYTNYTNLNKLISDNYTDFAYKTINYYIILIMVLLLCLILVILSLIKKIKNIIKKIIEKHKNPFTKEDKLKYIDQLTSLKNRAYLNSKVEQWDESEVYPQCVIVVDLNNISYINDNYGREEGDKVIREAANILIQNQIPNSEIIRTDGNEFLIYSVGFIEKEIVSYKRKLTREFKKLNHGFGAKIGYSMIIDEIKTFDDAVNEATIDMKQNKEEK